MNLANVLGIFFTWSTLIQTSTSNDIYKQYLLEYSCFNQSFVEIVSEFRFQNWANLSEVINIYPPWNAQKVFWMLLLISSLVQSFNTTELNQMHCSLQLGIKLKIPITILFSSELLSIIIIFCKFTLTLHKEAL